MYLTDSANVALNSSTTFRVMMHDNNGDWTAVHIDITRPNGQVVPFAYYSAVGADTHDWTLGGGTQGFWLSDLGTYTITAKTADYSLGYERWGTVATTTVTVTNTVAGNTYYLSTSGNDSNDGSQAAPWRSLNKINSLQPGDTILLERGDIWTEWNMIGVDFQVTATGTPQRWIKIGAYGSGSRPVVQRESNQSPDGGICFNIDSQPGAVVQYVQFNSIRFENSRNGINIANHSGAAVYGYEMNDCEFANMNWFVSGGGYAAAVNTDNTCDIVGIGITGCSFDHCFTGINAGGSAGWNRNVSISNDVSWYDAHDLTQLYKTNFAIISGCSINQTGLPSSAFPGTACVYLEYTDDVSIVGTTFDGVYHYGNQSDGEAIAIENGPATTGDPGLARYTLVQGCTIKNCQGPGIAWLGKYGAIYSIVQNNTFDNVNNLQNGWVPLGVPEQTARACFMSFNNAAYPPTGGAFINNTRTNIPTLSDGVTPVPRYAPAWANGCGVLFSSSSFSAEGPSD